MDILPHPISGRLISDAVSCLNDAWPAAKIRHTALAYIRLLPPLAAAKPFPRSRSPSNMRAPTICDASFT